MAAWHEQNRRAGQLVFARLEELTDVEANPSAPSGLSGESPDSTNAVGGGPASDHDLRDIQPTTGQSGVTRHVRREHWHLLDPPRWTGPATANNANWCCDGST